MAQAGRGQGPVPQAAAVSIVHSASTEDPSQTGPISERPRQPRKVELQQTKARVPTGGAVFTQGLGDWNAQQPVRHVEPGARWRAQRVAGNRLGDRNPVDIGTMAPANDRKIMQAT